MPSELLKPLSKRTPDTLADSLNLDSHTFTQETLGRHETTDSDGIMRPAYTINDREVVFRTRQETPTYDNQSVTAVGGELVLPIIAIEQEKGLDGSPATEYIHKHQQDSPDNLLVITNTPEGMLSAAALLTQDETMRQELEHLAADAGSGNYKDERTSAVIDAILSAVSIDDHGHPSEYIDVEGWPIALAALAGDTEAQQIVDTKMNALLLAERATSTERLEDGATSIRDSHEHIKELNAHRTPYSKEQEVSEPIPLEHIALVHSTSYPIRRDENGVVFLRSAGDQRDDKIPRASIHFTLNSRVVAHAQAQDAWDIGDKLIVANAKKAIDATKKLPQKFDGIDTWFVTNPGEEVKLPDALIVEGIDTLDDGAVITSTPDGVQFLISEDYSNAQYDELRRLRDRYGVTYGHNAAEILKEIALRIAMERQGVPLDLMDRPSDNGGHGMASDELAGRMHITGAQYGMPSGKHFETPEHRFERDGYLRLAYLSEKLDSDKDTPMWQYRYMDSFSDAALEARRRTLASGFYPARPHTLADKTAYSIPSFNMDDY